MDLARMGLLAVVASGQCGAFSRRQARECGCSDAAIAWKVRSGAWLRLAPGVYGLPDHRPTWWQRLWVARLAVDAFAAISHESAAAIHGCPGYPEGPVVVLVRHGSHPRVPGVVVHETRDVFLEDLELVNGLLVTTPARLALDLAADGARQRRIEILVEDLVVRRKTTLIAVTDVLLANARRGKPGVRVLGAALDALAGEPLKQSELERALFGLFDRFGGPRPEPQWAYPTRQQVPGCADAGYPEALLAVETDGRRWHSRMQDMRRDHERDAEAARHGAQVLRVLHEHVVGDPKGTWELIQDTRRTRLLQLSGGNTSRGRDLLPPERRTFVDSQP